MKYQDCIHIPICRHVAFNDCFYGCGGKYYSKSTPTMDYIIKELSLMEREITEYLPRVSIGTVYDSGYNHAIKDVINTLRPKHGKKKKI